MLGRLKETTLSATPFQQHVWFVRAAREVKEMGCVCGLGISYNNIIVTKMNTVVYSSSLFIAELNHLRPNAKPIESTEGFCSRS